VTLAGPVGGVLLDEACLAWKALLSMIGPMLRWQLSRNNFRHDQSDGKRCGGRGHPMRHREDALASRPPPLDAPQGDIDTAKIPSVRALARANSLSNGISNAVANTMPPASAVASIGVRVRGWTRPSMAGSCRLRAMS
jgi:hypothetical protein